MEQNLVSIITPMYNAQKYVGLTIESVIAQTYKNWEMIIVNDGSKDNCAEIVKEYTQKDNLMQVQLPQEIMLLGMLSGSIFVFLIQMICGIIIS